MNARTRAEATSSLVAETLRSWGRVQLRARGTSMLPTLWPGDVLTIQFRSFEQVEIGELVLYSRRGRLFIHRVLRRSGQGGDAVLITRGDCMAGEDPAVSRAQLLGAVTEVDRDGCRLTPARRLGLGRMTMAHLLCHWDLLRRVVLRLHSMPRDARPDFDFACRKAAS